MLLTPTTVALSVRRTLTSLPSRDFTVSSDPSKASMVPRTRTVGACCAHAPDPSSVEISASEVASARGINQDNFGTVFLPLRLLQLNRRTPLAAGYSAAIPD